VPSLANATAAAPKGQRGWIGATAPELAASNPDSRQMVSCRRKHGQRRRFRHLGLLIFAVVRFRGVFRASVLRPMWIMRAE